MFSTVQKSMLCINCYRDTARDERLHCVDLDTAYSQGCRKLDRAVIVSPLINPITFTIYFFLPFLFLCIPLFLCVLYSDLMVFPFPFWFFFSLCLRLPPFHIPLWQRNILKKWDRERESQKKNFFQRGTLLVSKVNEEIIVKIVSSSSTA